VTEHPIRMVEIETYTPCNRKCSYCPNIDHERETVMMPDELYDSIIMQLRELGFCGRMSFHFYNEPLLDPRLPFLVARAKQALPETRVVLYTNGDFLSRAGFEQLVDAGVDVAWVTNHGTNPRHCGWRHDLSPAYAAHLRYQTHENPEISWTNRGGLLPHIANPSRPLSIRCTAPATTLVITAHGTVVLCYEDYEQSVVIGDLRQQTIVDVWDAPGTRELRRRLLTADRSCTRICSRCNNTEMQTLEQMD
jgi:radical SAM protein with 4Fe4S-binding SPASM domain